MNIYVANIPYSVKDQDLQDLFGKYGEVTSAKIILDKATNRSRGFGFVEMGTDEGGRAAIAALNGFNISGRDLVVNEARPRTEGGAGGGGGYERRGGGGGGYGGGGGDRRGGGGGGYGGGGGGDRRGGGGGGGYERRERGGGGGGGGYDRGGSSFGGDE